MHFPVTIGQQVNLAEVRLASRGDLEALHAWSKAPRPDDPMPVVDAAEYAGLAAEKWEASSQRGRVVGEFGKVQAKLRDDPRAELIFLIVASIPAQGTYQAASFCLFRRTWAHNLFVDYLGTNPESLRPGALSPRGLGTGLLYTVMAVGHEIGAGRCMLEATDESFGFYRRQFRLMEVNDLCSLSPAEQWHYLEKTQATWARSGLRGGLNLDPKTL